jgi:hypothetical protein
VTVPVLYKLSDAVKVLGPGSPCVDTLRSEVKAGRLKARRIGRCLRVSDVELTRWALDLSSPPSAQADTSPPVGAPLPRSQTAGESQS